MEDKPLIDDELKKMFAKESENMDGYVSENLLLLLKKLNNEEFARVLYWVIYYLEDKKLKAIGFPLIERKGIASHIVKRGLYFLKDRGILVKLPQSVVDKNFKRKKLAYFQFNKKSELIAHYWEEIVTKMKCILKNIDYDSVKHNKKLTKYGFE